MVVPKINSAHGSETRNIINAAIDSINVQGKSIQDLVAEGQLTPTQYATLIQTVNRLAAKGEITALDFDKSGELLDATFFKKEFLQELSNGALNVTNVLPNTITTNKIIDDAITYKKTDFLRPGKNLFDKSNISSEKAIDSLGGIINFGDSFVSHVIPIDPSTQYSMTHSLRTALYDNNMNFLELLEVSSPVTNSRTFTSPNNAKHLVFSGPYPYLGNIQVELGAKTTNYENYEVTVENLKPESRLKVLHGEVIADKSIDKEKLTFDFPTLEYTSNLLDESTIVQNEYVNQTTGGFHVGTGHARSDYIYLKAGEKISFSIQAGTRFAFYDMDKNFVRGFVDPESPLAMIAEDGYVVVSFFEKADSKFTLSRGAILSNEPYGYRLKNFIGNEGQKDDLFINLPDKVYGIVGEEMNIYFDNIINRKDSDYDFDIDFSGKGEQFEDFFRYIPDVAESRLLTLKVIKNNEIVNSKTTTIITSKKTTGSGLNKKVLVIGDSTTNSGIAVTKLNDNFKADSMNITTVGTRGTGPNNHEGRSGWTARNYVASVSLGGVDNALYNPNTNKFDFSYYLTNNSISRPDYVIINLGINDVFSNISDSSLEAKTNEIISDYETMINSIKSNSSAIKIGLALTIPPNYSQDAFAKSYGTGQIRHRYKRNNTLWVKRMIEHFSGKESQGIYLIPTNTILDTKNNYGFVEEPINSRNSTTVFRPVSGAGVHPDVSGYWQIADAYWFWLKSFET